MKSRKSGPLQGLRVIVLPRQMASKIMSMILGDNGCSVVELTYSKSDTEPGWELSEQIWRRGKCLLELSTKEQLAELLANADIFITDFTPDELKALDCSIADLGERHPTLINCIVSGYGLDSPRVNEEFTETLVMSAMGFPWRQPGYRMGPKMPTFAAGSYGAAFHGVTSILGAVYARGRSGEGQVVDISIADGLIIQQIMWWSWSEKEPARPPFQDIHGGGMGRLVLESYQCADGEWIHIHTGSKGAFSRLMALAGLQDKIPPLSAGAPSEIGQLIENWQLDLIHSTLPTFFAGKTRPEWLEILRDLDIAARPDLFAGECLADPQTLENQLSALIELPSGEMARGAGAVLKFSETPAVASPIAERHVSHREALEELDCAARRAPFPVKSRDSHRPLLSGVKILDFGIFMAGPFASRILSDLGAEVIKIENLAGCPMRPIAGGRYWQGANRNKRTLALNLKAPESRAVVERLVRWADVVQHNMRPGVAEKLHMGYEDLRDLNPRLLYLHSPAFGSLGRDRELPGFEPLSSAVAGLLMRHADSREVGPYSAIGSMDPGNGMLGAAGIMMGLLHRERTGRGQFIECPQLGSAILSSAEALIREDGTHVDPYKVDADQWGFSWAKRIYKSEDGWIVIDAWRGSARARLCEMAEATEENVGNSLVEWMAARSTQEAIAQLRKNDIPAEPVGEFYKASEFFFNEDNIRMNRVAEYKNTTKWGDYRDLNQFSRFSKSPTRGIGESTFVADIGEYTRDILNDLGFSSGEIEGLFNRQVIGEP